MATSLDKLSASPYTLKYFFQNTVAAPDTFTKIAADVIADCAEGPLKTLLRQAAATSALAWEELPGGVKLNLETQPRQQAIAVSAFMAPNAPAGELIVGSPDIVDAIVTLKFQHSEGA